MTNELCFAKATCLQTGILFFALDQPGPLQTLCHVVLVTTCMGPQLKPYTNGTI
jgi:hypothetical protein